MRKIKSFYDFGSKIIKENGKYVWADTKKPFSTENKRKCPNCNSHKTKEGHDPCLGTLPGVKFACCGHGVEEGYIFFENNMIIRFSEITEAKYHRGMKYEKD